MIYKTFTQHVMMITMTQIDDLFLPNWYEHQVHGYEARKVGKTVCSLSNVKLKL